MGYLKLTVNPHDEEAFKRVVNYPARGIGKTTMEKIIVFAADNDRSLWDIAENIALFPLPRRDQKIDHRVRDHDTQFPGYAGKKNAYEVASHIAKSTGILKELYNDQSVEGLSRYENIQELLNSISEFTDPGDNPAFPPDATEADKAWPLTCSRCHC